jgi:poly(3-hydroxybutyrate) depolymerase
MLSLRRDSQRCEQFSARVIDLLARFLGASALAAFLLLGCDKAGAHHGTANTMGSGGTGVGTGGSASGTGGTHEHVFMTGFSMGGYFTNASGCARPDLRAIAPHSGGSYELTNCKSKRKPALIMHFNGDELIPTMCGQEARDRWVALNGCEKDSPDVHDVKGGRCEYYKGCPSDGQVVYCNFDIPTTGMRDEPFAGHAWSGGAKIGDSEGFAIPETESASELTWTFFKKYAW